MQNLLNDTNQQFESTIDALKAYKKDIESRTFPSTEHSYDMGSDINDSLKEWKKELKKFCHKAVLVLN